MSSVFVLFICLLYVFVMKILVLITFYTCCFVSTVYGGGFAQLIIGSDTLRMYPCPVEQDSVLEWQIQKRLVEDTSSVEYWKDYVSLWRLEEGMLFLEKIEKDNQTVDISGIFDVYRENGRIVARWFSGELLAVGGEGFYPYRIYTTSILCGPKPPRFETEITYTFRNGEMTDRKEVRNRLREQGNQMCHYTMGMLLNIKEMTQNRGVDFDVYIYPKSDGRVDRVEVMCRKEKLAPDDPATREAYACAELIGDWRVVTLDGEIQRVLVDPVARKYRLEMDTYLSRAYPDVLEMDGMLYRMDAFPLHYDSEVFSRVRPYLKGAFTTECPCGYHVRWKIAEEKLWLTEVRNAYTGELIPLSVVAPGNEGEAVEASWYTGVFKMGMGGSLDSLWYDIEGREMVSGDPVRKYIDREEIVCEVEQGYVVRQEIRNNFTRRGDTVAYRRFVETLRAHDWDRYPELKDRNLYCSFTVYPRMDGRADRIGCIRLVTTCDLDRKCGDEREDVKTARPWMEFIRHAAESIPFWDVRYFRGKVESQEVCLDIRKTKFDFNRERMYVYREDRGYETEKFIVVEQDDRNVRIFPKNYYSIRDSLNKSMFGWVDLLAVPFDEGEETIRENHPWNRWEKEMEKRVFGGGVNRIAKAVADSLSTDIMIDVNIYFDREGRLIVSSMEMSRPLFEVLPHALWERMFYESMGGDYGRKILEKVMNSISLQGLNDEYLESLRKIEKKALEYRENIASGDTVAQRELQDAFMFVRKSRPKANYGRVCISKRYYGKE